MSFFTMIFCAPSCRSAEDGKLSEKHILYLNQSLMKEAVPGIARIWSTSIELHPEVAEIKDLSVDYAPSGEVTLRVALDEILHFIETKHGVPLRWYEKDGCITIERKNQ
jgi:hypothetical protein